MRYPAQVPSRGHNRSRQSIFRGPLQPQEAVFTIVGPYRDIPEQLGSDATTVPRFFRGSNRQLPAAPKAELPLHVQAVIVADLGASWIGKLYAVAPAGTRPVKWQHVQNYVLEGVGSEPQSVRDGLQSQTVVLTDPQDRARSLDLSLLTSGAAMPFGTMVLMRQWKGIPGDRLEDIRRWLLRDLVERSGVGLLVSLVRQAMSRDWRGLSADEWPIGSDFPETVIQELNGNISRISKLACQATALAARQLDPDTRGERPDQLLASMRLSDGLPWFYAQHHLLGVSGQQVAFDRDDPGVTGAVERLRRLAHFAADEWGIEPDVGGVCAVDDADYIRVQVADVVCGLARTVIAQDGLVELVQRFRLVVFNGARLTIEHAGRLDRERKEHRELLHRALARGWTT